MPLSNMIFRTGLIRQLHTSHVCSALKIERSLLGPLKKPKYVHHSAKSSFNSILNRTNIEKDVKISLERRGRNVHKCTANVTRHPETVRVKITPDYTQVVRTIRSFAKIEKVRVDPITKEVVYSKTKDSYNLKTGDTRAINRIVTRSYNDGKFVRLVFRTSVSDFKVDADEVLHTRFRERAIPDPDPKAPPGSVISYEQKYISTNSSRPARPFKQLYSSGDDDQLNEQLRIYASKF